MRAQSWGHVEFVAHPKKNRVFQSRAPPLRQLPNKKLRMDLLFLGDAIAMRAVDV